MHTLLINFNYYPVLIDLENSRDQCFKTKTNNSKTSSAKTKNKTAEFRSRAVSSRQLTNRLTVSMWQYSIFFLYVNRKSVNVLFSLFIQFTVINFNYQILVVMITDLKTMCRLYFISIDVFCKYFNNNAARLVSFYPDRSGRRHSAPCIVRARKQKALIFSHDIQISCVRANCTKNQMLPQAQPGGAPQSDNFVDLIQMGKL